MIQETELGNTRRRALLLLLWYLALYVGNEHNRNTSIQESQERPHLSRGRYDH
jgi:hypothetical protein